MINPTSSSSPLKRKAAIAPAVASPKSSPQKRLPFDRSFDLEFLKNIFDTATPEKKYTILRELAMSKARFPIAEFEKFIRKYEGYHHFVLQAFFDDFDSNREFACAKHFGKLAEFEQRHIAQEQSKKIERALCGYRPDAKFFTHLLGDGFIRKTPWEGMSLPHSLLSFKESLRIISEVYGRHYLPLMEKINDLVEWAEKINALKQFQDEQELYNLGNEIAERIRITGSVALPGGWNNLADGHAIIYYVTKREFDYLFSIYNTGDGLIHHNRKMFGAKEKFDPVFEVAAKLEQLNGEFFAVLLGLNIILPAPNYAGYNANDIYRLVIKYLGPPIRGVPSNDLFMTPQRSGTCAVRCVLAFFLSMLGRSSYEQLKYYLQELHLSLLEKTIINPASLREDFCKNLYRRLEKLYNKGTISFQELFRTYSILNIKWNQLFDSPIAMNSVDFDSIKPFSGQILHKANYLPFQIDRDEKEKIHSLFIEPIAFQALKPMQEAAHLIAHWESNLSFAEQLAKGGFSNRLSFFYEELFLNLPEVDDLLWNSFDSDEYEALGNLNIRMANLLLQAPSLSPSNALVYRVYLYLLHILLVSNKLRKTVPDPDRMMIHFSPLSKQFFELESVALSLTVPYKKRKEVLQRWIGFDDSYWFDCGHGSVFSFVLCYNESRIITFLNEFLIAAGLKDVIPEYHYDAFYYNILKNKLYLPPIFFSLFNQYLTLFTNSRGQEIQWSGLQDERSFQITFRHPLRGIIKQKWDELIDTKVKDYKKRKPSVRIPVLMEEIESNPLHLQNSDLQNRLQRLFFNETWSGKSLLYKELTHKETPRFLNRLLRFFQTQLEIAQSSNHAGHIIFLSKFSLEIHNSIASIRPEFITYGFDRIINIKILQEFYQKGNQGNFSIVLQLLRFCNQCNEFDFTWLRCAIAALIEGAKDPFGSLLTEVSFLLKPHHEKIQEALSKISVEERGIVLKELQQPGLPSPLIRWPYVIYSNDSVFDLRNGKWEYQSARKVVYNPAKHTIPGLNAISPSQEIVFYEKGAVLEGNVGLNEKVTIEKNAELNPQINVPLLNRLLDVQELSGSFIYLNQINRVHLMLPFTTSRFEVWEVRIPAYKRGYIKDKETARIIYYAVSPTTCFYTDLTNDYHLIDISELADRDSLSFLYNCFTDFEDKPNVLLWQKNGKNDLVIELPRFNLLFDVDVQQKKVFSRRFTGFYLDEHPIKWEHFNCGLTLVNSQGKRLFLLPDTSYVTNNKFRIYDVQSDMHLFAENEQYMVFEVERLNKIGNELFFLGSIRNILVLADLLMKAREEGLAFKLLRSCFTNVFDKEVETTLNSIVQDRKDSEHPNRIAFKLHAARLYFMISPKTPRSDKHSLCKRLSHLAVSYSNNVTNVNPDFRLNIEELEFINQQITSSGMNIIRSWQVLITQSLNARSSPEEIQDVKFSEDAPVIYFAQTAVWFATHSSLCFRARQNTSLGQVYRPQEGIAFFFGSFLSAIAEAILSHDHKKERNLFFQIVYFYNQASSDFERNLCQALMHAIKNPAYRSLFVPVKHPVNWSEYIHTYLDLAKKVPEPKIHLEHSRTFVKDPSDNPIVLSRVATKRSLDSFSQIDRKQFVKNELLSIFKAHFIQQRTPLVLARLPLLHKNSRSLSHLIDQLNTDIHDHSENIRYVLKTDLKSCKLSMQDLQKDIETSLSDITSSIRSFSPRFETQDSFVQHILEANRERGHRTNKPLLNCLLEKYLNTDKTSIGDPHLQSLIDAWIIHQIHATVLKLAIAEDDPHKIGLLLKSRLPTGCHEDGLIERVSHFYELLDGKILREKQWEVLDLSQKHIKLSFQLGCGEGKTKLLSVALALAEIAKQRLVFVIVPKANLETNYDDLRRFFGRHTDVQTVLFSYHRESGHEKMDRWNTFLKRQSTGKVIVSDPTSIQTVLLTYFENLLLGIDDSSDADLEPYETMLRHFANNAAIIDEMHVVLDQLRQLNYALNKGTPLDPFRWEVPQILYKLMLLKSQKPFPVGKQYQMNWSLADYAVSQKTELSQMAAKAVFPQMDTKSVADYLIADEHTLKDDERTLLIKWLHSHAPEIRLKLQLTRAYVNVLLPHTLNARCNVNYGSSSSSAIKTAVPYSGNNSESINASFQNPDILVAFTIQLYLAKGLDKKQVKELLETWKEQEVRTGKVHPLIASFSRGPLIACALENEKVVDAWHGLLSQYPEAVFAYLELFVFSEIKVQTEKLCSTAHDLSGSLFNRIIAFTGTLLSFHLTLPKDMYCHFDSMANVEMINAFQNPAFTQFIIQEQLDFSELLALPNAAMVLDPHALLEGKTNEQVAMELVHKGNLSACHYFDSKTNRLIVENNKNNPDGTSITYCDQQHTVGTDTVQPPKGVGIVLANKGLTFTEWVQASKRMREFGKGQTIAVALTRDLEKFILHTMQAPALTHQVFLLWTLLNESGVLGKSLAISFEQQIHSIYLRGLLKKLLDESQVSNKLRLAEENRPLLVHSVDPYPFIALASLEIPQSPYEKLLVKSKEYETKYAALLDESGRKEIQALLGMASHYLKEVSPNETREELNISAEKEEKAVKENHDQLQQHLQTFRPHAWCPEEVLAEQDLVQWVNGNNLKHTFQYKERKSKRIHSVESLSEIVPALDLSGNLFFTENYSREELEEMDVSTKAIPPINFVLELKGATNRKFIVLSGEDADYYRMASLKGRLEKCVESYLFQASGYLVASSNGRERRLDTSILTQIKFMNGETHYRAAEVTQLKSWLTAEKMNHFMRWGRSRTIRHLKGSVLESVFANLPRTNNKFT